LIYDLDKIDEDFLKELYQELVDPEQRKLLGEFYTPDWLAETMINEVLKDNPELSIMDPACG
jgi:type I restriction-modification system DNA methylase subunit